MNDIFKSFFIVSMIFIVAGTMAVDECEPSLQATCQELQRPVLYIPWRESYIAQTSNNYSETCVFCRIPHEHDRKEFILARFKHHLVMLNLYPYTRGHLLIIPYAHVRRVNELSQEAQNELIWLIGESVSILEAEVHADGVNVGMNLGRAANASIPDHLHVQIVPRFNKECLAFMHIIGESRVIYWDMNKLFDELRPSFQHLVEMIKI